MRLASFLPFLALSASAVFLHERPAHACGGCFAPPSEKTVVTDHRMALSISPQQTVLWDQIRYSGDPREFAWVLPVRDGATVELSRDDWFSALDASTQPIVYGPTPRGNVGCALGGCGSSAEASGSAAPDPVQVLRQTVVGPYETVTLRSTDPAALSKWLQGHGYSIPTNVVPVIDAYVKEGFDFIALRLLPDCNVRSMKPVRIVTPGADPTLPLRMVAAGVGAYVGLTLYVIGEGRYHPDNFPDAKVDYAQLTWDRTQSRSNYQELTQAAMAQGGNRAWLTEYANQPQLYATSYYGSSPNPTLFDAYYGLCGAGIPRPPGGNGTPTGDPCTRDAGVDPVQDAGADAVADGSPADAEPGDADVSDAQAVDAQANDAGNDAASPPPYDPDRPSGCTTYDDLFVATRGLHKNDVWVTRLRANLAASALSTDLHLAASSSQAIENNVHSASVYGDTVVATTSVPRGNGCSSVPSKDSAGAASLFVLTGLFVRRMVRRRRGR